MSNFIVTGVNIVTPPTEEPVSLTEFKQYFNILGGGDDQKMSRILASCRNQCELYTGRKFINTTLEFWLDNVAKEQSAYDELIRSYLNDSLFILSSIQLPHIPAVSISSIKYYDVDNTEATYSSGNYFLDSINGRVVFNNDAVSPSNLRSRNSIKITYVAGYGATADLVPSDIRQAILDYATVLYQSSKLSEDRVGSGFMPKTTKELLQKYKIMTTSI